ncbi:16S rRNA (guanine(966)-N(2))-methyltransferase RsmD [Buchnera aphidicola]|uniref:Ribosomal RNA small subunit methyltransferase D n=1 Tax=Buchnera aphidicola (Sarucallis kahawaluokalani) TaxID=1241878 RepID=A0A4D6Y9H0_9GAMM|nr:16S rRNA (guanine(966)-N(2))-methyltransferase RsmD [Buchnera aphidicola]QCI25832.1 16S rRNA (guanine(966)-N(2))-methyltransferase RsmD [Buchnera aphidicola (Sarucallis kahawaluokalani)]
MKKKIRIISGTFKGKNITTITDHNLRPTMHRIRETLFNWLSQKISNANCLDCFAGSGALSIESISRAAKYVTALENNKKILYNLKKNIVKLNIENIKIIYTNTLSWLKNTPYKYDIIFLDPPYNKKILQKTIFLIEEKKIIKQSGYIYIEKSRFQKIYYPKNWILHKNKYTKNINYKLYFFNKI